MNCPALLQVLGLCGVSALIGSLLYVLVASVFGREDERFQGDKLTYRS